MSKVIDWAEVGELLRCRVLGEDNPGTWSQESDLALQAAAKLCEAMPLIGALLAAVGELPATGSVPPEQFDDDMPVQVHVLVAIDDLRKRLREAVQP